jgi:hypothetical protein
VDQTLQEIERGDARGVEPWVSFERGGDHGKRLHQFGRKFNNLLPLEGFEQGLWRHFWMGRS